MRREGVRITTAFPFMESGKSETFGRKLVFELVGYVPLGRDPPSPVHGIAP